MPSGLIANSISLTLKRLRSSGNLRLTIKKVILKQQRNSTLKNSTMLRVSLNKNKKEFIFTHKPILTVKNTSTWSILTLLMVISSNQKILFGQSKIA